MKKYIVPIMCNNSAVVQIAKSGASLEYKRKKYLDLRQNFLVDAHLANNIQVFWLSTDENVSDLFTKSLGTDKFEKLRDALIAGKRLDKIDRANGCRANQFLSTSSR